MNYSDSIYLIVSNFSCNKKKKKNTCRQSVYLIYDCLINFVQNVLEILRLIREVEITKKLGSSKKKKKRRRKNSTVYFNPFKQLN